MFFFFTSYLLFVWYVTYYCILVCVQKSKKYSTLQRFDFCKRAKFDEYRKPDEIGLNNITTRFPYVVVYIFYWQRYIILTKLLKMWNVVIYVDFVCGGTTTIRAKFLFVPVDVICVTSYYGITLTEFWIRINWLKYI